MSFITIFLPWLLVGQLIYFDGTQFMEKLIFSLIGVF